MVAGARAPAIAARSAKLVRAFLSISRSAAAAAVVPPLAAPLVPRIRRAAAEPPAQVPVPPGRRRPIPHAAAPRRRLQHAQAGDAPVLLRVETRAGHGGATPTAKLIEKSTDEMAFLVKNLGMEDGGQGAAP